MGRATAATALAPGSVASAASAASATPPMRRRTPPRRPPELLVEHPGSAAGGGGAFDASSVAAGAAALPTLPQLTTGTGSGTTPPAHPLPPPLPIPMQHYGDGGSELAAAVENAEAENVDPEVGEHASALAEIRDMEAQLGLIGQQKVC